MTKFLVASIVGVFTAVLFPATSSAFSSPKQIPRPARWVQVTDPKHLIAADDVAELDSLLESHRVETTNQISVVVVDKVEKMTPKEFAVALFNDWKIGDEKKDNGLLILLSMNDRRVEFEVGYGLEGDLPDVVCKRIQMEAMVPEFKSGNYGRGLVAGVRRVVEVLQHEAPQPADSVLVEPASNERRAFDFEENVPVIFVGGIFVILFAILIAGAAIGKGKNAAMSMLAILLGLALIIGTSMMDSSVLAAVIAYYIIALLFVGFKYFNRLDSRKFDHAQEKYSYLVSDKFPVWSMVVFPVPVVFLRLLDHWFLSRYRRSPQKCYRCGGAVRLLSETDELKFLTKSQTDEQKVKSVDYDVYFCDRDQSFQFFKATAMDTDYTHCPKCHALTNEEVEKKVVVQPTYSSSGRGETVFRCASCNEKTKESYIIPQLQHSSSSSGGSSGGSSSGGSSYSGGGSSGGGGSGSSW